MKGSVLHFIIQTNQGCIVGDNGKMYRFYGSNWNLNTQPKQGIRVDFDIKDGGYEAILIYEVPTNFRKQNQPISRTTIALAAFILLPFYLSYYFYVVLPNDIANENTEKIEKANKIYKSNNSELINIYKPGRYGTHLPSHEQCYGDQHIYLGFSNGSIDEGIDLPCSTTKELCSGTKNMYKEDVNYDDSEKLEDVKSSCKSNGW